MTILWMVGAFILVLTPIILIHELGHFWAARLSKIRIEEFGLGFPPRAKILTERNGTIYSLNWIPVGGFVRPAGEDDPNVPGGLAAASKRARVFVLAAGAGANFLLAIVLFWIAALIGPAPDESRVAIGEVISGSPAALSGLQVNDVLLEVNGLAVDNFESVKAQVEANAGQPIPFAIERDGERVELTITPRRPGEYDPSSEGAIGVVLTHPLTTSLNPIKAAVSSVETTFNIVRLTVSVPAMVVRGQLTAEEARPVSIVGISQIAGQAAESTATTGNWGPLLRTAGFISVALGFTNLLPLPALDGGRIFFVLVEAIRGRRVEPEREGMVHLVGMLVLLGLMLLMIVQDIINPIIPF